MSVDELEASLRVAWDNHTAAVYADRLTAEGDPRGVEDDEHCYHLAAQLRASSSDEVEIAGYHRS